MIEDKYLDKLHKESFSILKETIRICDKYNLKYFLTGGTLLGAVRNQDFIPWDDDVDILMPRKDFDRFSKIAKNELSDLFLHDFVNENKYYFQLFQRVCKKNTIYEPKVPVGKMYTGYISLDIFPMDNANGMSFALILKRKLVCYIWRLAYLKWKYNDSYGIRRILSNITPSRAIYKLCHFIMVSSKKGNYCVIYPYPEKRYLFDKDYFGEGVKLKFCDNYYNCPCDYDKFLNKYFGIDYMTPPSEDMKKNHNPNRIKFSDGETVTF